MSRFSYDTPVVKTLTTCNLSIGVLLEMSVQHGITDLVANLI